MHTALAGAVEKAKRGGSDVGPTSTQSGAVIDAFRNIFSEHATKILSRILRLSDGAAKKKIQGERVLSLDDFAKMLRTERGFHYLTAVMADSNVKWWRICRPMMEVAEVTELQLVARRKLKRAISGAFNADADLTSAIARADALLIHDSEFYGHHADAQRAMAGVPHRAVAPSSSRGRR